MNWETHRVFNQPKPLSNSNLFLSDTPLREAVSRQQAGWDADVLASLGQQLGSAESLELGRLANTNPPELLRYDSCGERLDDVRFHPAWHLLMQGLIANRVHNLPWQEDARIGSAVARAARFILHGQVEAGTLCPVTMTFGAILLLQKTLPPEFRGWLKPLLSDRYDPHLQSGDQKKGVLIGMGMTEKQGGSDVRSNTTRAEAVPAAEARALFGDDSEQMFRIVGHKWFFSAPQCDAHLILAQRRHAGVGHRHRALRTVFHLADHQVACRPQHLRAFAVQPRRGVRAVADRQGQQRVPGGMEFNLVDAMALTVVVLQRGRVAVGEARQIERFATPQQRAQQLQRSRAGRATLRLHGFAQGRIGQVQVEVFQRRHGVVYYVGVEWLHDVRLR